MSSYIFERRRAERFSELVDESSGQRRRHRRTEYDAELVPLATLAASLGTTRLVPSPGKEYRFGLRAMLMATIEREGIGACAINPEERPTDRPWQSPTRPLPIAAVRSARSTAGTRRRTRVAVLVGVTTGALVLSGVSMAGTNALPGDPFYGLKLQTEKAQVAMAGSEISKGVLYLKFARVRLDEVGQVSGRPLAEALRTMITQTKEGLLLLTPVAARGDNLITDEINNHVERLRIGLSDLPADLTGEAESAKSEADSLVKRITTRMAELRNFRAKLCNPTLQADDLGARPVGCAAASGVSEGARHQRTSRGGIRFLDR